MKGNSLSRATSAAGLPGSGLFRYVRVWDAWIVVFSVRFLGLAAYFCRPITQDFLTAICCPVRVRQGGVAIGMGTFGVQDCQAVFDLLREFRQHRHFLPDRLMVP